MARQSNVSSTTFTKLAEFLMSFKMAVAAENTAGDITANHGIWGNQRVLVVGIFHTLG